jgi:DNA invertase Pin-like site-specific DNA recombinase
MKNGGKNGAVLYGRVAVASEAALHLGNQERNCREYCQQQSWPVAEVFADSGVSGNTLDRPAFQQLLEYCRVNWQDTGYVVVQDLPRIARDTRLMSETVAELERMGIGVASTDQRRFVDVQKLRNYLDDVYAVAPKVRKLRK